MTGCHGSRWSSGHVEVGDGLQGAQVEHARDLEDVLGPEGQTASQDGAGLGRHGALDLEPHRLAEASPPELLLDGQQQIVRLVLLDGQVGVARDPEEVVLDDLHAREEGVEVGGDDLLHEDVGAHADLDQARQHLGHLDAREVPLPGHRVADGHGQREREIADVGERVSGVDGQGRQDREDLVDEHPPQLEVALGPLVVADDADALVGQRLAHLGEGEGLLADEVEHLAARLREGLRGAAPVGSQLRVPGLDLLLEAGHADLEELVEVAREDGQEADALEERVALVARLVQDARVEVEPRELTVDVRDGRRGRWARSTASRGRTYGGHGWSVSGLVVGAACHHRTAAAVGHVHGPSVRPPPGTALRWILGSAVGRVGPSRAPLGVLRAGAVGAQPLERVVAGVVAVGPGRAERI